VVAHLCYTESGREREGGREVEMRERGRERGSVLREPADPEFSLFSVESFPNRLKTSRARARWSVCERARTRSKSSFSTKELCLHQGTLTDWEGSVHLTSSGSLLCIKVNNV
jgi:hypothetical protein